MGPIPSLATERLVLRPFRTEDAFDVQRLAGDRAIADTTLHIPHPYLDGMAQEWIARHPALFAEGTSVTFAITNKHDSALIGAIALMAMSVGHQAELGYWIGRPYWNQGYCTEAGRALLGYAFTKLGLVRVYAYHFTRNPASGRVMRKLGMHHEGTRRQQVERWGILEDDELYGLLKTDWSADH